MQSADYYLGEREGLATVSQDVEQRHHDHDCKKYLILHDGESVCGKCGKVDDEALERYLYENGVIDGMAFTADDHNAGNKLLHSQTEQNGYVSPLNPGVAMKLNNPRGKDAFGKRIKPQLMDPYLTGLIADRGLHIEEDPLTGKPQVKFSRYDIPLLQIIKEKALKLCTKYHLDVVEQHLVSKELTRLYSNLAWDMCDYMAVAGILNNRHLLPKSAMCELEEELAGCVSKIRDKVVSGCAPKPSKSRQSKDKAY